MSKIGRPQREIPVEMLFDEERTAQDVADELGIGRTTVAFRRQSLSIKTKWAKPYKTDISDWTTATRKIISSGYVARYLPKHELAVMDPWVMEHRLVILDALGDIDDEWSIHHRGAKDDNRLEMLIVFKTKSDHARHHVNLRKGLSEVESLAALPDAEIFDFELTMRILIERLVIHGSEKPPEAF